MLPRRRVLVLLAGGARHRLRQQLRRRLVDASQRHRVARKVDRVIHDGRRHVACALQGHAVAPLAAFDARRDGGGVAAGAAGRRRGVGEVEDRLVQKGRVRGAARRIVRPVVGGVMCEIVEAAEEACFCGGVFVADGVVVRRIGALPPQSGGLLQCVGTDSG